MLHYWWIRLFIHKPLIAKGCCREIKWTVPTAVAWSFDEMSEWFGDWSSLPRDVAIFWVLQIIVLFTLFYRPIWIPIQFQSSTPRPHYDVYPPVHYLSPRSETRKPLLSHENRKIALCSWTSSPNMECLMIINSIYVCIIVFFISLQNHAVWYQSLEKLNISTNF